MSEIERIARIARISIGRELMNDIKSILEMFDAIDMVEALKIDEREGMLGDDVHKDGDASCEEKGPRTV